MGNISGEQTLSDLFNGKIFYRIPDYQRGYAWGKEQLQDFWEDLENSKGHKHYTGVLSLVEVNDEEKEKHQWVKDKAAKNGESYYIVDGQQRLTTSIILLKVILDSIDENTEWFADEKPDDLHKRYISKETPSGKCYFFGYTFDNPSHKFLRAKIFGDDISEGIEESVYTKNLESAKEFFKKKINGSNNSEEIFKTLTQRFVFNVYQINNSFDVFVAFETMNNRGKPLSSLELLKNRLIYLSTKLGEEADFLREKINECWKEVYKFLGKNKDKVIEDDDFLKVHWLMYFDKYKRTSGEPHKEFLLKKHFILNNVVEKNIVSVKTIKDYSQNLKDCVEHYYFLYNLDNDEYKKRYTISDEIIKWLEKIQRLNFGAFEPLLMAVLYKRAKETEKGFDDDAFVELLKHIEKFLFLMFMLNLDRKANFKVNEIYSHTYNYFVGQKSIDNIKDFVFETYREEMYLDSLKINVEIWFKKPNGKKYGYFAWKGLRYFLFEYEESLRDKDNRYTKKILWERYKDGETIEHILPQKTDGVQEWENMLNHTPEIKNKRGNNRQLNIIKLKNSLGNLVPLSKPINSEIQNKPFNKKVEKYKTGSYSEIEISQSKKWDKNAIENRTKKLLNFMFERWGINEIIEYWENNEDDWRREWAGIQKKIQKELVFSIPKN